MNLKTVIPGRSFLAMSTVQGPTIMWLVNILWVVIEMLSVNIVIVKMSLLWCYQLLKKKKKLEKLILRQVKKLASIATWNGGCGNFCHCWYWNKQIHENTKLERRQKRKDVCMNDFSLWIPCTSIMFWNKRQCSYLDLSFLNPFFCQELLLWFLLQFILIL